jgi:5-methylcytosine-specific restriction endonuclease McrA
VPAVVLDPALPAANQGLASLDALAAQAFLLEPPSPDEIPHLWREEAAPLVDGLLVRVARGRGALDVAIGEGLAALADGDRALRLGFSGIGDYARERLGIAGRTAQAMARLARGLRDRPVLRQAVRGGEVSARKAAVLLPVARGEAEEGWVARARVETVRALEAAAREASGAGSAQEDAEPWDRIAVPLSADERARVDEAMSLAGRILGAGAPKWQRLEAICQEFLAAHPVEPSEDEEESSAGGPIEAWLEAARLGLELETRQWEFLASPAPVRAAESALDLDEYAREPSRIDAELRRLAGLRDRWDDVFGHLAVLMKLTGLWRDACFADFAQYCAERLGMAERTVAQRIWLSRRLYSLPELRQALREGRLSYEQARLVASVADDSTVNAWIARAERTTCIALRREIEAAGERQMCARGELDLRVPRRVHRLLCAAFRAAREAEGRWLKPGECLLRIAGHFIATWGPALKPRSTRNRRVLARNGGWCTVPGCSRPAAQAHHIVFRSRGGSDDATNRTGMCSPHHLHGVHAGYIRVRGEAPDGLVWELGVANEATPRGGDGPP